MVKLSLQLDKKKNGTLQQQIFEQIAAAIMDGHILMDEALPSSRKLAGMLNVSRNTVVLAYDRLLDNHYLVVRPQSGYFVNPDIVKGKVPNIEKELYIQEDDKDWASILKSRPACKPRPFRPRDWQKYDFPFISGQPDPALFPVNNWRECCRDSLSVRSINTWVADQYMDDDPYLIEQIQSKILPRRGIWSHPDQILVTMGAQHGLYLLVKLLLDTQSTFGIEDPGHIDIRNLAELDGINIKGLPIDSQGLIVDGGLSDCDCIYTTPNHQYPTAVCMSLERRLNLLRTAARENLMIIEDDYDSEQNLEDNPVAALKSLDEQNRVMYVGSFSKIFSPGVRLGYIAGPAELMRQARALRRLICRHPPANNQRAMALFIARGYFDALRLDLMSAYQERSEALKQALAKHLPDSVAIESFGSSSCWLRGPDSLDTKSLESVARKRGVIIESGHAYFMADNAPANYFRLGFSSIPVQKIAPGVKALCQLITRLI